MELLLGAAHVLTGAPGERIPDGAVLVRDHRIDAVGPWEALRSRASAATSLRFPGCTLLPGLIDCHTHLALDAGPDPVETFLATDDLDLLLAMAGRARQLLGAGVTTVRDLGDRNGLGFRLRDAIAAGALPGPRILSAGAPLTPPGGHCWFFGGEVNGAGEIRQAVRTAADVGADVIKMMVTGGRLTRGGADTWESQFTLDEIRAAVDQAHGCGLRIAAHAHGTEGIARAVEAGVDTVEHCSWFTAAGVQVDPDAMSTLIRSGIQVSVTVSCRWRELIGPEGWAPYPAYLERIAWMESQGIDIVLGTDAGLRGAHFDDPVSALESLSHLGFSNARILEIATVSASRALGLSARTGRLEAGLAADLLVVGGDPLADLAALREVRFVLQEGRPHVPDRMPDRGSTPARD